MCSPSCGAKAARASLHLRFEVVVVSERRVRDVSRAGRRASELHLRLEVAAVGERRVRDLSRARRRASEPHLPAEVAAGVYLVTSWVVT